MHERSWLATARFRRYARLGGVLAFSLVARAHAAGAPWDGPAFAAPAAELLKAATDAKAPSAANAVILLDEQHYDFDDAGRLTTTRRLVYRIDGPAALEGWASIDDFWQPWHQKHPVVRARVVTSDGVQHDLDPKVMTDTATRSDQPLTYDDGRLYQGPLPAVAVGAVVEMEIVNEDREPFFAAGIAERLKIGEGVPVLRTRVSIEAPASMPLRHRLTGLSGTEVAEVRKGERVLWSMDQGPLDRLEEAEPLLASDVAEAPELEFSTGASWQAIAASYATMTEPRLQDPAVGRFIEGLDPKLPVPELAAQLVARLHKKIRYTGIEFGEAQLIPHAPAETIANGYGDCKDKSALLAAAFRALGVPAYLAVLSSGPGQDLAPDFPGFGRFDHAIVYVPGAPDLWIDATAEYARVGDLPYDDEGRLALVIRPETTALLLTPLAGSARELEVETREFTLAEEGYAAVVETTEAHGQSEMNYRSTYSGPKREANRKQLEEYARSAYVADGLTSYQASAANDFSRPFTLRLEIAGAKRGTTEVEDGNIWIPVAHIFNRLPSLLSTSPDTEEAKRKAKEKPRVHDVVFRPFVTEWHYRITLPPGFRVAALPAGGEFALGPARLTESFTDEGDRIGATLRFDTVKGRYTPAEATEIARKVTEYNAASALALRIETRGHQLMGAGDVPGALREYEALAKLHPTEALHRVQVARTLLAAGLAERARAEATAATHLEPKSALAWKTLGWTLQHDAIGRRWGAGYDPDGAVAAYRKAVAIDPKDDVALGDLAIILEFDKDGYRYGPKSHLAEAIATYRERAKLVDKADDNLAFNLVYALFRAERFKEVLELLPLPRSDRDRSLKIAAVAALSGTKDAIELAAALGKGEEDRSQRLSRATDHMVVLRRYAEAADLMAAAASGEFGTTQMRSREETLRKTRHYETFKYPDDDPRSLVLEMLRQAFLSESLKLADLLDPVVIASVPERRRYLLTRHWFPSTRRLTTDRDTAPEVLLDVSLSNTTFTYDGDAATGYRVHIKSAASQAAVEAYFVVRGGKMKFVTAGSEVGPIGFVALEKLKRGDLAGARTWLDWAREVAHVSRDDDPYSGEPFPVIWKKGEAGDAIKIAAAATALLGYWAPPGSAALLNAELERATDADEKRFLRLELAYAAQGAEDWQAALAYGEPLLAEHPESPRVFGLVEEANRRLKRWPQFQATAEARLKREPEDLAARRALALVPEDQHRFEDILPLLAPVIASEKASVSDFNSYAWNGLLTRPAGKGVLEAALTAHERSRGATFAVEHTLACVYAVVGKPKEARETLLGAMSIAGLAKPDDTIWFGAGLIAEAYGDAESARRYYARIEKPDETFVVASSVYAMGLERLAALKAPH